MPESKAKIMRHCIVCGKPFLAKNVNSVHCSKKCSDETFRNKKRAMKKEERRQAIVDSADGHQYLTAAQVINKYNISKPTLYRWIRLGKIKAYNPGKRMTLVDVTEIETILEVRKNPLVEETPKRLYSLEPEDCYTIGEVSKLFRVSESTVYSNLRKFSIPLRQIGRYVYVPKFDIDKIFKSEQ